MTSRGRHRLAASVLLAVLGTACGGGGGAGSNDRSRAPESQPPELRRAEAVGALRSRSPASAAPPDASPVSSVVPPPGIVDRGTDPVAIARSLVLYGRWLEAHHPDPALVERAYAPNSPLARSMKAAVKEMRGAGRRVVEVDRAPLDFAVLSERANVVSFRVTERTARRELVDARGRVLQRVGPATERYLISIMRFASDAPWRLNLVERQGPRIEVQL